MDFKFSPSAPAEIELSVTMTASIKEWRELAAAISVGVKAATPEPAPGYSSRTPSPPETVGAALRFATQVAAMATDLERKIVIAKVVKGWGTVEEVPPPPPPPPEDLKIPELPKEGAAQ